MLITITLALSISLISIPSFAAWNVWLDHSVKKYRQGGEDGTNGSQSLTIKMAKNEFESFQILIYANGENLSNVNVYLSNFTKGSDIVNDITIYKQHYVNCSNKSRVEYATGYYPDALLPKVDRYYHEARNTFPFAVTNGKVQGIWVDVGTASTTAPGTYQGYVTVTASGKSNIVLPVTLLVWDFNLPSTATYPSSFYYQRSYMSYGHGLGLQWGGTWLLNTGKIYDKCALYHRISPAYAGGGAPNYSYNNGILTVTSWGDWIEEIRPGMNGTSITSGPYAGARFRAQDAIALWNRIANDANIPVAYKQSAQRQYLQQLYNKFNAEGWDPYHKLFVPVAKDEPNGSTMTWRGTTMTDYNVCIDNANDVNSVNTSGLGIWKNIYVNSKNVSALSNFASKGFFDPWVGRYVAPDWDRNNLSSTEAYSRSNYAGYPNNDMRHWAYMSCMSNGCQVTGNDFYSGQVDWSADAPAMYNRMWSFVWWKYEIKGVLYWGMNEDYYNGGGAPYNSIWYYGSNGDGHLLYPGVPASTGRTLPASTPVIGGTTDIPIESIRLKYIRDAMEDLEYMELAKETVGKSSVDTLVDEMFTTTDIRLAYYRLNTDPADLFNVRENIAELVSGGTTINSISAPSNVRIQLNP